MTNILSRLLFVYLKVFFIFAKMKMINVLNYHKLLKCDPMPNLFPDRKFQVSRFEVMVETTSSELSFLPATSTSRRSRSSSGKKRELDPRHGSPVLLIYILSMTIRVFLMRICHITFKLERCFIHFEKRPIISVFYNVPSNMLCRCSK